MSRSMMEMSDSFDEESVNNNHGVIVFMGTGGMWSYSIGFTAYMREHFGNVMDRCLFSATSGGTMPAALACQPSSVVESFDWHKYTMVEGMREMQDDWTYSQLYNVLGRRCKEYCGRDGRWHERAKSRLHIPYWSTNKKKEVVANEWKSTDELIDCVLAACHIPFVIDGRYAAAYRDDHIYDIGLPWGYDYYNPAPELPFLYFGPRNQLRTFPKAWQSIYRNPLYTQFLYDTGYKDAKRFHGLLAAFFIHGQDVYLGEGDIPERYGLRERWHQSTLCGDLSCLVRSGEKHLLYPIHTTNSHVYGNDQ